MRTWRDVDELPDFLDDELEQSFFVHSLTSRALAGMVGGLMAPPDDPLLDSASGSRQQQMAEKALARISPQARDHAKSVREFLNEGSAGTSRVEIIAHLLRELEALIRGLYWEIACSTDPLAAETRNVAKASDLNARDASHREQVDYLASVLGFSENETRVWRAMRDLPRHAHRTNFRERKELDEQLKLRFTATLDLLEKVAIQSESSYGSAITMIAGLARRPAPPGASRILDRSVPAHPRLTEWFFSQVEDSSWLDPLFQARMLDDSKPMDYERLMAPASHASRLLARLAKSVKDGSVITRLFDGWIDVDNPRLHTDMAEVLLRRGGPMSLVDDLLQWTDLTEYHSRTTRLMGDRGVLRFPSHCLKLIDLQLRKGGNSEAVRSVQFLAQSLGKWSGDADDLENQAHLCLAGYPDVSPLIRNGFLKFVRREVVRFDE